MSLSAHADALALADAGDVGGARQVLQDAVLESLNDLAVLLAQDGDPATARDLLRAVTRMVPGHADAEANLAALPADDVAERRARFLQVVSDSCGVVLADNIDHLFNPMGDALVDPSAMGAALEEQLAVLERAGVIWTAMDERSRALLLRWLAHKALGPAHVRLELEPGPYRQAVIGLTHRALVRPRVVDFPAPFEWQLHHYDLRRIGIDMEVIGPPLPLASTFIFSQYAHRDPRAGAGPRLGDIAIDVGGCWGETALWLADRVGPAGHVHTFEPAPANRELLHRNLELNPHLAGRITVHSEPLAGDDGDEVWMRDALGAGVEMRTDAAEDAGPLVSCRTASIDGLIAAGRLPRADFLKVDVEGADLGVLHGAARTIREHRPRMAIACYHKPDDVVTIPGFVASLDASYAWHLQCSTMTPVDTVAFAVPRD